jgi:hypothetical protein
MYRTFLNLAIGAFAGGLSGYIVENYNESPWKIFAFLWAAPILLFVPIYVSYHKGETYIREFLYHAFLGASLSIVLILFTLLLLNVNIILALVVNFLLSLLSVHLYFKYKLYV